MTASHALALPRYGLQAHVGPFLDRARLQRSGLSPLAGKRETMSLRKCTRHSSAEVIDKTFDKPLRIYARGFVILFG